TTAAARTGCASRAGRAPRGRPRAGRHGTVPGPSTARRPARRAAGGWSARARPAPARRRWPPCRARCRTRRGAGSRSRPCPAGRAPTLLRRLPFAPRLLDTARLGRERRGGGTVLRGLHPVGGGLGAHPVHARLAFVAFRLAVVVPGARLVRERELGVHLLPRA